MSTTSKENGDITDDSARPQRKPRINRRSFHLSINDPLMNLLSDKPDKEKPNINGDGDTENKRKSSVKELISFSSSMTSGKHSKNTDKHSSTIISLKKSSCHENNISDKDSTLKQPSTIISLKKSSCLSNSTSCKVGTVKNKQSSILVSVKNTSSSSSENGNSDATAVSGSEDPPKKKHKPITWP